MRALAQTDKSNAFRAWAVASILLLTTILFWSPLKAAVSLSFRDDRYLPVAVAPLLCVFLLWWERRAIFPQARFAPRAGAIGLAVATLSGLALMHWLPVPSKGAGLAPVMLAVIVSWLSAFLLCYGAQSFRNAIFALCCLLLMIPVPVAWMDRVTVGMEHGSAVTSWMILRLLGVPVFREGMTLNLPGLTLDVAPECSGIRSWLGFILGAILATRIYLRSGWSRATLIAVTVPIAVFKNAIRIVLLGTLTVYVDRHIIDSPLHHQGGPVFAVIDVVIFVPLLALVQRVEGFARRQRPESQGAAVPSPTVEARVQ